MTITTGTRRLFTLLAASGFAASVALASSPENPVSARLVPAPEMGKHGVKLTLAREAEDGFEVTVKRPERPAGKKAFARNTQDEPRVEKTLGKGLVNRRRPLVVDDTLEADANGIVRAHYEVELKSEADRYQGLIVVDQAFVVGSDGALTPIDFTEEMKRTSGKAPTTLAATDAVAGAGSPAPR